MAKGDRIVRLADEHKQPIIVRYFTQKRLNRLINQLTRALCYHEAQWLEDEGGPGWYWAFKHEEPLDRVWEGPFRSQKKAIACATDYCNQGGP